MKDEPHSHKKATVALVAVLLLAYVGSYLWMKKHSRFKQQIPELLQVWTPIYPKSMVSVRTFNLLYWPLRKLDQSISGEFVGFAVQ